MLRFSILSTIMECIPDSGIFISYNDTLLSKKRQQFCTFFVEEGKTDYYFLAGKIRPEQRGDERMRLRKQALGNRNLVGAHVELARKNLGMKQKELLAQLQVNGIDMNASGLSKLEGQIRYVTDFELVALSNILNVSVDWLLGRED